MRGLRQCSAGYNKKRCNVKSRRGPTADLLHFPGKPSIMFFFLLGVGENLGVFSCILRLGFRKGIPLKIPRPQPFVLLTAVILKLKQIWRAARDIMGGGGEGLKYPKKRICRSVILSSRNLKRIGPISKFNHRNTPLEWPTVLALRDHNRCLRIKKDHRVL